MRRFTHIMLCVYNEGLEKVPVSSDDCFHVELELKDGREIELSDLEPALRTINHFAWDDRG